MNNKQKGSATLWIIVIIVLLVIGGGIYLYKTKTTEPSYSAPQASENQSQTTVQNSQSPVPIATGRGGGVIAIPATNDFQITSPTANVTWDKGDSSKTITWQYPTGLIGHNISLHVYLVNTDLTAQGRDSDDPDVSLHVFDGFVTVPASGTGSVSWDTLQALPETPFYGYSGNSKILVVVSDSTSLKTYAAASGQFAVSSKTVTSSSVTSLNITAPTNSEAYSIGQAMNITWTGMTNSSDTCQLNLVGPLDQNGQVIQSMGAIIPLGSTVCSNDSFSWTIASQYLHNGYDYNLIIKTPYNSYSRTIRIN